MVFADWVPKRCAAVRFDTTGSAAKAVAKVPKMARAAVNRWRVVMGEVLRKGSLRSEMEASLVDSVGQLQGEMRPIFGRLARLLPQCLKL